MGHAGQKLRLVAAGDLELSGLGLQLPEKACVDDGQRRLAGEGLEQLGHIGGKVPVLRRRITSTPTIFSPRSMGTASTERQPSRNRMSRWGSSSV